MIAVLLRAVTAVTTLLVLVGVMFPATFAQVPATAKTAVAVVALLGTVATEIMRRSYWFPERSPALFPAGILPEERVPALGKLRYDIAIPADELAGGKRAVYWAPNKPAEVGVAVLRDGVLRATLREETPEILVREVLDDRLGPVLVIKT